MHRKIPIWKRLRKAAGLPQVMAADLAGLLACRLEDIEAGRVEPSDVERNALWDVLVGAVKPQPVVGSPLEVVLLETVNSVAKGKDVVLTAEQARDLATVVANVVKQRVERAFAEPAGAGEHRG